VPGGEVAVDVAGTDGGTEPQAWVAALAAAGALEVKAAAAAAAEEGDDVDEGGTSPTLGACRFEDEGLLLPLVFRKVLSIRVLRGGGRDGSIVGGDRVGDVLVSVRDEEAAALLSD